MRVFALLVFLAALVAPTLAAFASASPLSPSRGLVQGDDSPFPLTAPWPSGQAWMAGNGGYYYGDGTHKGAEEYAVDFNRVGAEDYGQPIYAAADGVVVSAGWLDGYGNSVVIAHRRGVRTTYGHFMLPPSVLIGQMVTTDSVLGFCGSTRNSTGPHLHFSVRRGSVSLKPEPMEGRSLVDGLLLVAGPKPQTVQDRAVLADLVRTAAPRPEAPQYDVMAAAAMVNDDAKGGRRSRPHMAD